MTSSPDGSGRETLLLRGAPAAGAVPYQRVPQGAPVWGRPSAVRPAAQDAVAPAPAAPVPPPRAPRAPSVVPPAASVDPGTAHPTAAHSDQAATTRVGLRLGEVYAEQLARLRAEARREGWAAGHAEGVLAAEQVVRAAEQAAEERLAEVQARWERRLASATAAMGAAVERLDGTAAPVVDELRDSILDAVVILVGDLFGRELAVAAEPGLDALRRAMTLCPDDVPVVVRLHPDDLAEVPAEALAQLPASVTVRGDDAVERAGAVAEAGTQRVDAQLSAALDRVREVLRS
ncbi:FliH/SctL family protein [Modestobacter sp. VKM Ac-2979]|uniref:FliH/SctL family protein n=1 Tax=unclassified Modestobacter TaxID=2643866 RepID=UPI0022AB5465|nr:MULTISPECIES: FliH/SctL family protein [unclassified Modestobacter]MCZ2810408.1 FliH/SctL family protein [Modestobacter sp. VKM Ac-2979]MCZ2841894.1 FliH/SctL family protein [Modestobacter sp. VKM Ac-2980]